MSRLDQAMQALRDAVALSHARNDEQRLADGGEVKPSTDKQARLQAAIKASQLLGEANQWALDPKKWAHYPTHELNLAGEYNRGDHDIDHDTHINLDGQGNSVMHLARDNVNLYGTKIDPHTLAHEVRHRSGLHSEFENRLADAMHAQTPEDWADARDWYADYEHLPADKAQGALRNDVDWWRKKLLHDEYDRAPEDQKPQYFGEPSFGGWLKSMLYAPRDQYASMPLPSDNYADGGEVEGPTDEHGPLSWVGNAIDWLRTKGAQGRHAMSDALPTSLLAHMPAEDALLPDQGSTNFLRREHLPDLSIENAEPHYAQEDSSEDPNWFSETTPFKFHNPHDVEQTADAALNLGPLVGPVARGVRGIPRALGEGLMELGGHGTMSAAMPALARAGDARKSLGEMMDELRKIMPAMNFARLSKMADYAPGGLKYMSPHGLYELGTTPAEVAMVRPGSMLDWSKPMVSDRNGADVQLGWNDELLRSAMVAQKMEDNGLNWAPAVTVGADGSKLATVGHQGRHREYGFHMLGDADYSPMLLMRHHPKYDVHPMYRYEDRAGSLDVRPLFEYHQTGPRTKKTDWYDETDFDDPGPLADWQSAHGGVLDVTPQLGRNPPPYLSGSFGPYKFPRKDVKYDGPIFARGGLAAFDEVE